MRWKPARKGGYMKKRSFPGRWYLILLSIVLPAAFLLAGGFGQASSPAVPGEIVILWDSPIEESLARERLDEIASGLSLQEHIGDYTLCYLADGSMERCISLLNRTDGILAAEPNYILDTFSVTNDTYSDTQWALNNPGQYVHISGSSRGIINSTPDVDMDIPEAWLLYQSLNPSREEVVVAVIDTGIDYRHPDLKDHMWKNSGEIPNDGIDNDGNGYIDDIYGWDYYNDDNTVCHYEYNSISRSYLHSREDNDDHGTHVAGIIAAVQNNRTGIAGIASNTNVRLMSLKIHGGADKSGTVADAVKAVKYAQNMGAQICNMSWGSSTRSEALELAMKESSMLFICAAGNEGLNNDITPLYPASYELDNIISVTFFDANGLLTINSNYGLSVDIAAPGSDIYSTIVGTYGTMSGSSMAAPHITGLAAILYSLDDNLYPQIVRQLILSSTKDYIESANGGNPAEMYSGYLAFPGIPSAYLALEARDTLKKDTLAPSLTFDISYDQSLLNVLLAPSDDGGSGIRTIRYSIGSREPDFFRRGTEGIRIKDTVLPLNKAGTYTFYISDYAGNEEVFQYDVKDDEIPPDIEASYSVSEDYDTITVRFRAYDGDSGVKQVKYQPGTHTTSDFRSGSFGFSLPISSRGYGSFKVEEPGPYTIYAVDYRGNKQVYVLGTEIIPTTRVVVEPGRRVLSPGSQCQILPILYPMNSTDTISFSSSNPSVAGVSSSGLVTALKPGKTVITVTTASGEKTNCIITVVS